uniref:Rapamycin-insensitive companion of mTOR N-terminal domain-containing protein n=1 Tax=Hucho hucho TaxID=62062 RepID=A0A4W5KGQ6_9TELE
MSSRQRVATLKNLKYIFSLLHESIWPHGITNMRKLGHLNNFTKVVLVYVMLIMATALVIEMYSVALFYSCSIESILTGCITAWYGNCSASDRKALQRVMITVNPLLFPSSVTNSLIAVGTDGLQERDRMVRATIAINPEVVAKRGGLSAIIKSVIDCQLSRINEALITTILHLLNHPHTRQYISNDVELELHTPPCARAHTHIQTRAVAVITFCQPVIVK